MPNRRVSDRIDAAVEAYPNRWTHHVMIGTVEEVDEELLSWIVEAAELQSQTQEDTPMPRKSIFDMPFSAVYAALINKTGGHTNAKKKYLRYAVFGGLCSSYK